MYYWYMSINANQTRNNLVVKIFEHKFGATEKKLCGSFVCMKNCVDENCVEKNHNLVDRFCTADFNKHVCFIGLAFVFSVYCCRRSPKIRFVQCKLHAFFLHRHCLATLVFARFTTRYMQFIDGWL